MKKKLRLFSTKELHFGHRLLIKNGGLIIATCFLFLSVSLNAQTTHNFATAGDWSESGKWTGDGYPGVVVDVNEKVFINEPCNLDVNVQANDLIRLAGSLATFTVPSGRQLLINLGAVQNQVNVAGSAITIEGNLIIGQTGSADADFINNGGSGGTTVTSNGSVTFAANGVFTNNGQFTSALTVDGNFNLSGGTLTNNGTIKGTGTIANMGTVAGRIAPGNSVGTLNVDGDITPTGNIDIEVDNSTTYDVLNNSGTSNLNLTNATVNFDFTGGTYSVGNQFTVFTNFTSYTGTPAITSNSHTVVYNGNGVFEISVLPVELVDFSARKNDNAINLHWRTASELNNEGFQIEHSADGAIWSNIGFVAGHGTSHEEQSYNYTDQRPLTGMNYYRLKQMDFDGNNEYSPIRSVYFEKESQSGISVFPNPVSNSELTLVLNNGLEENGILRLYSLTGNLLRKVSLNATATSISTDGLNAGVYILEVTDGRETWQERLIIQ